MAGFETEVVTGKLTQTANALSDLIARYGVAIDRYYTCGAEIGAMLDGDISKRFMLTLTNDREKFDALSGLLRRYVETLDQVTRVYTKTNTDILDLLSGSGIK